MSLWCVATFVVRGVLLGEIFVVVAYEVSGVFGIDYVGVVRFESDGSEIVVVIVGYGDEVLVGMLMELHEVLLMM